MAGALKKRSEKIIHVFGDIYLKSDELNMIIVKRKVSKKTKKIRYAEYGYFISAKALLSGLYDRYALERVQDGTIAKPETLIGIENFVNKVEECKIEFEKINKWKK